MSAASGAGAAISVKAGIAAAAIAVVVSVLAIALGFRVVPLKKGREMDDAINRLAAGLLCSFTIGPAVAFWALSTFPFLMAPWQKMLEGQHILWQYLASAAPIIALCGVFGFWVVAGLMRWFVKREGKDIGEIISDAKQLKP